MGGDLGGSSGVREIKGTSGKWGGGENFFPSLLSGQPGGWGASKTPFLVKDIYKELLMNYILGRMGENPTNPTNQTNPNSGTFSTANSEAFRGGTIGTENYIFKKPKLKDSELGFSNLSNPF